MFMRCVSDVFFATPLKKSKQPVALGFVIIHFFFFEKIILLYIFVFFPRAWAAPQVEWLLARGADPLLATHTWTTSHLSAGSGQTAAHWAAQSGFEAVAAALVAASPLVALSYDEKGLTPLALALQEGQPARALHAAAQEEWLVLELDREDSLCRPLL
jgi:hypothetical protein